MAFANLFSGLSAICEDVRSPGGSDVTSSNRTENGSRGRKRKTKREQPGSFKKRCPQFQTEDNFTSRNKPCQKQVTERERSFPSQKQNSSYNSRQHCNGPNYQTKDNRNMKKEKYQGKKNKKNCQQRHNKDAKPMSKQQAKPKFMTQDFKDQNALLVDGRLLCRHFLSGRCIKEDKCQLEHCQGYNGLIKDACKFYVQGFCLKGESCPYMHTQSFPCKFFHRKGKCLLEGNCRFSHEPLNDITEKLLDEAMKQEKYFYELANKNKEESSEQQANTEETKPTEEQKNPDLFTQPLRPSFYNSTNAEKEPDEHPDVTEQGVVDADQPHSSSVNTQNQQEPVCYSVEAVLGPQLSRTFFSFSKTLVSQDSSSDRTCANQSNVPYSVEAVFSSDTSAGYSSNDPTPDPPSEQAAFYASQVISEKIKAPPSRREKPPPNLRIVDNGSKDTMPRSLLSLEVKDGLISGSRRVLPHTFEEELGGQKTCTKQELLYPEKSASSRSREIKHSLAGTKFHEVSTEHACPPKHPTQLKPSLSKGGVAVLVEPVTTCNKRRDDDDDAVHRFQLSETLPNSKKKQSNVHTGTLKHPPSNTLKSCSKTANQGGFSAERNKTQNRPFSSLFASPLTDSVTPGSESSTAAMKPRQSEDVRTPSLSFISLFAAPLSENPPRLPRSETQTADSAAPPCKQQSAESAASNSKQRDSDRRFFPPQVRTSHRQTSSESSKTENDAPKQPSAAVVSSSPCDPSSSRTNQNLPDVSPSGEASAPSVLKSLFVQLRPYQEDGEQQVTGQSIVQSEDEKEKQQKNRRKTRTKEEVGGDAVR